MISRAGTILVISLSFAVPAVTLAQTAPTVSQDAASGGEETPSTVRRIPDTLMFSIDELTDIQSRITTPEEGESRGPSTAIENASLYLSTILYTGPNDWTIWVNGKPITPGQDFAEFKVTGIGPRYVELLIPLSAQGMRPVRLEPNQTFITRSGAIVEGAWQQR